MEDKLLNYRCQRENILERASKQDNSRINLQLKDKLNEFKQSLINKTSCLTNILTNEPNASKTSNPKKELYNQETEDLSADDVWNNERLIQLCLKILLWFVLLIIFFKLEFTAVYIIFSLFYAIYANMRTSKRKRNELSAYSVFNPNLERIDGTLTSEQLEKNLLIAH